jgi:hypothetical protein
MCQPARSTFGWTVKLKLLVRGRPVRAPAAVTVIECAPAATGTRAVSCREPELVCTEAVVALPSTASETPLDAAFINRPRIEVEVVSTGYRLLGQFRTVEATTVSSATRVFRTP